MSKWIASAASAAVLLVAVGACSAQTAPTAPAASPTAAAMPTSADYSGYVPTTVTPAAPTYTPAAPTYPLTAFGSGTYLVGSEVTPGRYVTEGAASCYWEVQRENADQYGSKIIENGNANGHTNITIPAKAYAIEVMSVTADGTDGCTFTKR
jgi:hypothetical protein